jgi:hypothetical protein
MCKDRVDSRGRGLAKVKHCPVFCAEMSTIGQHQLCETAGE